jgi:eukaryotic-like serine/threonine-protein kinase
MHHSSAPEPGTMIAGKYRVERVLGAGGMGVVVAAHHVQLDQQIAIKFLLPEALKHPEIVERFSREARSAAKIRGEHVARVIDVGQFDNGTPFMVMEYLEGHDLQKQLEESGPLPIEDAVRHILEACEALAEAHAAKIVHRDLKPANLFLATQPDRSSIVKVLDFGISKVSDSSSAALTQTASVIGTAYYMSPEQLMTPKLVDHRSDIWSLGVILYELLGGRPPFCGESVPEIIAGILQNAPAPLRTLRPDLPFGLEEVIATCMRPRDARHQSVAKLARALAPFASAPDRISVEIVARVLNEPAPESASAIARTQLSTPQSSSFKSSKSTAVLTPDAFSPASIGHAGPASTPNANVTGNSGAGNQIAAVTANGLSTSAIVPGVPQRGAGLRIAGVIAAVAVTAAAIAGGVLVIRKESPRPAAIVTTAPTPIVGAPSSGGAAPLPAETAALPADPAPPAGGASESTPVPHAPAPAPAIVSTAVTKTTRPTVTAVVSAARPASPAQPTTAAARPTTSPPSPSSAQKSNPLNMGIK